MKNIILKCLYLVIMIYLICSACSAVTSYTITDLGTLGGNTSVATAINSLGQVVGYSTDASGQQRPFIWRNDTISGFINRPYPAYDINDSSEIVGDGMLWRNDVYTPIDAYVKGINNLTQAVGYKEYTNPSGNGSFYKAFLWQNGVLIDLGTLAGTTESRGYSINDLGQVAGQSGNHAAIWSSGGWTDIGFFAGGTLVGAYALSINNTGVVVGHSDSMSVPKSPPYARPFIWKDGVMRALTGGSVANSINDMGQIVGNLNSTYLTPNIACLWDNETYYDLNTLIPSGTGWQLKEASDINNSGQIVGWGYLNGQQRAYLLTPVPEPSSLFALASGVGGMIALRRRRR